MMKQAVIDSNVLVAIVDSRDNWHGKAQTLLNSLEAEEVSVIYFDCVLNETISVLARRAEEQKRSEQFSILLDTLLKQVPIDEITWISSEIQRLYRETVEHWSDQDITNNLLLANQISGKISKIQRFQGTVCKVRDTRSLKRLLNHEPSEEYQAIKGAKEILVKKVERGGS